MWERYKPLLGHERSQEYVLAALDKRDAEGTEMETTSPGGKRVLEYILELEETQLIDTNLSYLTFLRRILSHFHINNHD